MSEFKTYQLASPFTAHSGAEVDPGSVAAQQPMTRRSLRRGAGFTLIEVMVSLGLLLVMLAIIFVPLTQAFEVFNIGRTSTALQQSADQTVKLIAADLQRAIAVYPNDALPGITDRPPYSSDGSLTRPFFNTGTACGPTNDRVSNTARIDFLVPERYANPLIVGTEIGSVGATLTPAKYIVTYYARLYKDGAFDAFSNPIVIYRAQMPYQLSNGNAITNTMNVSSTRYNAGGTNCERAKWLFQAPAVVAVTASDPEEPVRPALEALSINTANGPTGVQGSHSLVTPLNMAISAIKLGDGQAMRPDLTFSCEDVNSDGIIDRVRIRLTLSQYEEGNTGRNGEPSEQKITATQVVDLPNVKIAV
jgi:prepilin-type N-terminal cleavage/methylation domain-containing protein